jgi:hypothetical protein
VTEDYKDRCSLLYYDIVKENAFLTTNITLKDCYGKVVFKSETGASRTKAYELAYPEALNEAFVSVDALHYKYTKEEVKKVVEPEVANKKRGAYGLF